jgi:hypothetical protein
MRRRRWPGWEGEVESPVLCFALTATLAVTCPAEAGHYRSEVVQAFRPAVTGGPEGPHYNESAQRQITDASDAALVSPETIVEIDASKLKGDPGMLAWAPDSKALYLQMIERDRKGAVTSTKHFVIAIAEKTIASVDSQPAWVGPYWTWKAAPSSPATSTFKIVPSEREEIKHAMAPVGDLAKGGAGAGSRHHLRKTRRRSVVAARRQGTQANARWRQERLLPRLVRRW